MIVNEGNPMLNVDVSRHIVYKSLTTKTYLQSLGFHYHNRHIGNSIDYHELYRDIPLLDLKKSNCLSFVSFFRSNLHPWKCLD